MKLSKKLFGFLGFRGPKLLLRLFVGGCLHHFAVSLIIVIDGVGSPAAVTPQEGKGEKLFLLGDGLMGHSLFLLYLIHRLRHQLFQRNQVDAFLFLGLGRLRLGIFRRSRDRLSFHGDLFRSCGGNLFQNRRFFSGQLLADGLGCRGGGGFLHLCCGGLFAGTAAEFRQNGFYGKVLTLIVGNAFYTPDQFFGIGQVQFFSHRLSFPFTAGAGAPLRTSKWRQRQKRSGS